MDVIDYNLLSTDAIEVLTAEPTIGNVLWIIENARIFISWLLSLRARMGSESISQEAKGQMGYGLRGHEHKRNNFLLF